jgi:hypothetical protein
MADVPVSVTESEQAPITITPAEDKVFEVTAGEKLTIPLKHIRRSDFSGANITLKTFGDGFEGNPAFDATLKGDSSEAVLDLAKLKPAPGEYNIAFYGYAVARYRENPTGVALAEAGLKQAKLEAEALSANADKLAKIAESAPDAERPTAKSAAKEAAAKAKAAQSDITKADKQLKAAVARAKPKDIVDIIVSTPIRVRVNPAKKAQ